MRTDLFRLGLLVLALALGCAGHPRSSESDFISEVAGQSGDDRFSGGEGATDAGAAPPTDTGADDGDAARAIAEADIIQLDGNRLFALSRYSGMTIVDLSDPSDLAVLGRYATSAVPFEMYLEDGIAYVMFNGYWSYELDEDTGEESWQSTARLQALDVSDPGNIQLLGDAPVAGEVSDSRIVGDVLYLVTYQNGWCWRCDREPSTRVASFDVSDPQRFALIDELAFAGAEGWGPRSIEVTTERMYVGGDTWETPTGSVQVVDISDPLGDLVLGAEVPLAGPISSRWQMNEHAGVLRVISQPGGWGSVTPPVVETFDVTSAHVLTPLGRLTVTVPPNETLRSVRFDGKRAYAITQEVIVRSDPLVTFDLSDPANPRQLGDLAIPGWVYHMEPRGDRIYALGYDEDDTTWGRGMTVSIFDVSDMEDPRMLDRVVFGGEWSWAVEDQDRIHKAFNLMLEQGLIFVPFAGGQSDEETCSWDFLSGIQIIDVVGDDLRMRGIAPQYGTARRSLFHEGTLYGVSDNAVQSFDISDRDAPAQLDVLDVARNISSLHVVGDEVLRFGNDWWTGRTVIDVTTTDDATTADPDAELDLGALIEEERACGRSANWGGSVFPRGDYVYVPRYAYEWGEGTEGWESRQELDLHVVHMGAAGGPALIGRVDLEAVTGRSFEGGQTYESYGEILLTESALLVGRRSETYLWDDRGRDRRDHSYHYDVFDLSDPAAPRFTTRFEVPRSLVDMGWGIGPVGCGIDIGWGWWYAGYGQGNALVSGDIVASNHAVPLRDGSGRVRYFLDRLDVSDPARPRLLRAVNIPGQLASYDAARGYAVTVEDVLRVASAEDWSDCHWRGWRARYDEDGTCRVWDRRVNGVAIEDDRATRLSSVLLDAEGVATNIAVSSDRVFALRNTYTRAPEGYIEVEAVDVLTVDILPTGRLRPRPDVRIADSSPYGWYYGGPLQARDGRAFLTQSNEVVVVDATGTGTPTVATHDMPGWSCQSLQVSGDRAYCAMGHHGVLAMDL